jgi:hypothetical protein
MMTKTVRHTISTFGDRGGDFARAIGSGTADFARRFGDGTSDLARRVGTRRALIGLAVLGVAIGGSVLVVRYLRARREREAMDADRLGIDPSTERAASLNRTYAQRNETLITP